EFAPGTERHRYRTAAPQQDPPAMPGRGHKRHQTVTIPSWQEPRCATDAARKICLRLGGPGGCPDVHERSQRVCWRPGGNHKGCPKGRAPTKMGAHEGLTVMGNF